MKFIAIIPSRYGSTRFAGKPLVDIFGKPMVVRVYESVSQLFEHTVIATDNEFIKNKAEEHGCTVILTSESHNSGTDRCCEALNKAEGLFNTSFDVVINVQGDEPFIVTEQLQQIRDVFTRPNVEIATLVKPFGDDEDIFNPNTPKVVMTEARKAIYFSRNAIPHIRGVESDKWQKSHTYYKHIGLYAYRADVLRRITELPQGVLERCESLEQLRWLENGYKIDCEITLHEAHAIDTQEDLTKVLKLYEGRY